MEDARIIRMQELTSKVGLQRSTIYGLVQLDKFPKPFKIAPDGRAIGWLASDVENWLAARASEGGA